MTQTGHESAADRSCARAKVVRTGRAAVGRPTATDHEIVGYLHPEAADSRTRAERS